jgi:hypothetical protein
MAGGWYAMNSLSSLSNALALLTALGPPSQSPSSDGSPSSKTSTSASSNLLSFGQVSASSLAATLVNNALAQGTNPSGSPDALLVAHVSQNSATTLVEENGQGPNSYGSVFGSIFENEAQLFIGENSLTSQQISDALYSGTGLQMPLGIANATFAGMINSAENNASFLTDEAQWLSAGMPSDNNPEGFDSASFENFTPAQISSLVAEDNAQAASDTESAGSLLTAFNNHTLTFEKATDVQGLDYSATFTTEQDGPVETGTSSDSYNQSFLTQDADGKQHALAQFGDVMLYLSW